MQTSGAIAGWLVYTFILWKKAIEADAPLVAEKELALSIYMMLGGFYENTLIFANSPSHNVSSIQIAKLAKYQDIVLPRCQIYKL